MDLIDCMLEFDESKRITISEIKKHPWYQKEVPLPEKVRDFMERKQFQNKFKPAITLLQQLGANFNQTPMKVQSMKLS